MNQKGKYIMNILALICIKQGSFKHLPNLRIPQTSMMAPLQRARNGAYPGKNYSNQRTKSEIQYHVFVPFINLENIKHIMVMDREIWGGCSWC